MSSALFDDLGADDGDGGTSALFDGSALFDDSPAVVAGGRDTADRQAPQPAPGHPAPTPAQQRPATGPGQPAPRAPRAQPARQQPRPERPRPQQFGPSAPAPQQINPVFAPQFTPQAGPPAAVAHRQPSATVRSGSGRRSQQATTPPAMIEATQGRDGRMPKVSASAVVGALIGFLVVTGLSAASVVLGFIVLLFGVATTKNVVQSPTGRRTAGGVLSAAVLMLGVLVGLMLHFMGSAH